MKFLFEQTPPEQNDFSFCSRMTYVSEKKQGYRTECDTCENYIRENMESTAWSKGVSNF